MAKKPAKKQPPKPSKKQPPTPKFMISQQRNGLPHVGEITDEIATRVDDMDLGAAHLGSGILGGCAGLGGSMFLVSKGMMQPITATIILAVIGSGMTYLAVKDQNSHLLSSGVGCVAAGAFSLFTVMGVDAAAALEKRLLKQKEETNA